MAETETVISTESETPESEAHAERAADNADHAERESDNAAESAEESENLRDETEAHADAASIAASAAIDSAMEAHAVAEETREARTENQEILERLDSLPGRIAEAIRLANNPPEEHHEESEQGETQAEITAGDPAPGNSHWYFQNIKSPFKKAN